MSIKYASPPSALTFCACLFDGRGLKLWLFVGSTGVYLSVGFLSLRYSVLFTVESLSLLYLLSIS